MGAAFGNTNPRVSGPPMIEGVGYLVKLVRFIGGSGNTGMVFGLSHDVNLVNPVSRAELMNDKDVWVVSGSGIASGGLPNNTVYLPPPYYLIAGPQRYIGYNGSSGTANYMTCEIYYEPVTISSKVEWAALAVRTSHERQ